MVNDQGMAVANHRAIFLTRSLWQLARTDAHNPKLSSNRADWFAGAPRAGWTSLDRLGESDTATKWPLFRSVFT